MRGLEHYSGSDDGALYRFSLGVLAQASRNARSASAAAGAAARPGRSSRLRHLDHDKISAKLASELREHPLLLLPIEERRTLLRRAYAQADIGESPPDWLWNGMLGRKNAAVFDALLASYGG